MWTIAPTWTTRGIVLPVASCSAARKIRCVACSTTAHHTPPRESSHASTLTPDAVAMSGMLWSVPVAAIGRSV